MYPKKRILQVTYNSQLKVEVRKKADLLGLANLEIHTYNSLCVKYYDRFGYKNDKLRAVILANSPPLRPLPGKDVVVLDETQDMNMLFYQLIKKFIAESPTKKPQLLILGDKYQSIYKFIGADSRFLTLSPSIWERPFLPCTLTTSYRLTPHMASFVNEVMLGYPRIVAGPPDRPKPGGPPVLSGSPGSPRVSYKVCDMFRIHKELCKMLVTWIQEKRVKPDDIFVLAGSIKGAKAPIRLLENALASNRIPCYYPVSDEKTIDEEIIEGKVVFSTFHQAKGRERKIVIVYGFDESYFTFYGEGCDPEVCPETLYVAATRAKERLLLLQGNNKAPLPFLKRTVSEMMWLPYMSVDGVPKVVKPVASTGERQHAITPTELVRYLNEPTLKLLDAVAAELYEVEEAASYSVAIPSKVTFVGPSGSGTVEDVSDINGIAIPAMYDSLVAEDESTIETFTRDAYEAMCRDNEHPFLQAAYKKLGKTIKTPVGYVRLTVMYVSLVEKLYHKMNQITHYNWITNKMMSECFEALDKHIPDYAKYEQELHHKTKAFPEYGDIVVKGRMDVVGEEVVLELKCVDALTLEHKMQLVVYAWMWREECLALRGSRVFKLVNLRTGETLRLKADSHLIDEAMRILMDNKYTKLPEVSDVVFVERCLRGEMMEVKEESKEPMLGGLVIHGEGPCFVDEDSLVLSATSNMVSYV
jgi:hypothetical protein